MKKHNLLSSIFSIQVASIILIESTNVMAHEQHAHVHGEVSLNIAIDEKSVAIEVESPLDNFLSFERAPKTEEEKRLAAEMVAKFNQAETLFTPDPAALCTLKSVELHSEALSLNSALPSSVKSKDGHDHAKHSDLDATVIYSCKKPQNVRFIDQKLFENFKNIRRVNVQLVTPKGQFKRTLNAGNSRLTWER